MIKKITLSFLLVLATLCTGLARESTKAFWTDCSSEFSKDGWKVYKPVDKKLSKHGYLVVTTLDQPFQDIRPQHVLGELYGQIDQLSVMGQKEATVGGQPGLLLSFRGAMKEKALVGRAAFSADGEKTKLMMLVRHTEASDKLIDAFEDLVKAGTGNLPTSH